MNNIVLFFLVTTTINALLIPRTIREASQLVNILPQESYNTLLKEIQSKEVSEIAFTAKLDSVIVEHADHGAISEFTATKINPFVINTLTDLAVKHDVQTLFLETQQGVSNLAGDVLGFIGNNLFPLLFFVFFLNSLRNGPPGGGPPGMGIPSLRKSMTEDKIAMQRANVSLSSFAGSEEIMMECTEVVSYLKNATSYQAAGAEIPRGVLLEGPPGTGKTLLAKAIASEADANFVSVSASEFVEVFVGVGASKIRSLFDMARKNKPCILFIDEIDAVGRQRGAGINMANDEREQTLNQLLSEMDGFADNEGVLVIAATNRKDVLDQALLRPGRFDRVLTVPYPDRESRKAIMQVHAKNKQLSPDINLDFVAELTTGFSGAQLKNLLNEAAIYAARAGETIITNLHMLSAIDKLIVGLVKQRDVRSDESKRRVAIHEIGHALLAAHFPEYFDLKKVTIQSTYNGAGGFTIFSEYQNITDSGLYTKDLFNKRLVITLGGKAAESVVYGDNHVSLGAVQDLKQANSLARSMIGNYGMGNDLEVFFNENGGDGRNPFLGRTMAMGNAYAESTMETLDRESLDLVIQAYYKAKCILSERRELMDALVEQLLQKTTLLGDEFRKAL